MFTPDELRALALLLALVTLGAALTFLDARHPKILALTLGDSLALGAASPEAGAPAQGAPAGAAVPGAASRTANEPPQAVENVPNGAVSGPADADSASEKSSYGLDGRLDLNRASADELEGLPGIGPKTAQRILEDRRTRGPFRKVSDLTRVKGIGAKTLARLLPHVTAKAARDAAR
jgi:competence ComEA-like helix-hairpin-helix protein